MRVLFISNSSAGMYSFRKEVIEAIYTYAETFLCAPTDNDPCCWDDCNCTFIPFEFERHGLNPIKEMKQILYYRRLIKGLNPDICLTYTIKPNVYAGLVCSKLKIQYIANVTGLGDSLENGGIMQILTTFFYKLGLRKASCVFFQNEANMDFFLSKRIVSGNARIIPGSGVNLEKFSFEPYPVKDDQVVFLYVARIKKDKGIEELLEAITNVRNNNPECIVNIVGSYEEDYSNQIEVAEKRGDVKYYGLQEDMHSFYSACHCVVLPSYHEGTSNVLLEGAATGRPVIASRVPGCQETFDEGFTGLGCEAKDASSLAEAMKTFLSKSYDERKKMGQEGRRKMEREFNRKIVIEAYKEEVTNALL